MYTILTILCLIHLGIVLCAFNHFEETRLYFGQRKAVQHIRTTTTIEKQQTCEYHRYSTRFTVEPKQETWYLHSKCFMTFQSYNQYDKGCMLTDADKTAVITCPVASEINVYNVLYGYSKCQNNKSFYSERHYNKHCINSSACTIPTKPAYKKKASIYFHCRAVIPVDGRSMESHVFKPVDDRRTRSHCGIPVDDTSTKSHVDDRSTASHVFKPVENRTTKSHGGYNIPGHDRNMESNGFPNYAFIVGGIVGVLLIICIIVGVVLLRRRNCSVWRNAQMTSKNKVITKFNPTYDITDRQREPENYQQAYFMNSPDALHLATSHDINLDNRTGDNLHPHDVKLCHAQKRSVLTNDGVIKEDSATYSHLRNTMDDSDVMYDHTVHNTVHDTCDGDYGVTRIRITDDDYDVSGNYLQSLTNKAAPVYN